MKATLLVLGVLMLGFMTWGIGRRLSAEVIAMASASLPPWSMTSGGHPQRFPPVPKDERFGSGDRS